MIKDKIRLFVVDDNKEFADILGDYLESTDIFEVVGKAENGLDALKSIGNMDIDLVILDLIMPKLDGIGVLEELRRRNLKHRPKIVVLSAIGGDEFTKRALNLGADYYVIKPFEMKIFVGRILELFNGNNVLSSEGQSLLSHTFVGRRSSAGYKQKIGRVKRYEVLIEHLCIQDLIRRL